MLSDVARRDPAMTGQLDYERVEADFYPTPTENVDCLHLLEPLDDRDWWEPACGEGHIARRVAELTGRTVVSTDLYDRGYGTGGLDFLRQETVLNLTAASQPPTGIITNPPYGDLAEQFVRKALTLMKPCNGKVVMFLRNEFDCGKNRRYLFLHQSFSHKIVVTKRPRWIEGSKGSPRHSYSWYIWDWMNTYAPCISYVHPDDCYTLRKQ